MPSLVPGKQIENCGRKQMRRRVTQNVQTFKRLRQDRFDLNGLAVLLRIERESKINFAAINARRQSLLRRVAVELLQRFADGDRRQPSAPPVRG